MNYFMQKKKKKILAERDVVNMAIFKRQGGCPYAYISWWNGATCLLGIGKDLNTVTINTLFDCERSKFVFPFYVYQFKEFSFIFSQKNVVL